MRCSIGSPKREIYSDKFLYQKKRKQFNAKFLEVEKKQTNPSINKGQDINNYT